MILKTNQENMQATLPFGLKFLFDGYLINSKFLCDTYVINKTYSKYKTLIINCFLCDGYVIKDKSLFDGYLIKEKL